MYIIRELNLSNDRYFVKPYFDSFVEPKLAPHLVPVREDGAESKIANELPHLTSHFDTVLAT